MCFSAEDKSLQRCLRETFLDSYSNNQRQTKGKRINQLTRLSADLRKLDAHSGTLIALVKAGIPGASRVDDFSAKLQLFCFHRANGANHHVEQNDAVFFARHAVGVAYDHLIAMLAN